MVDKEKLAYWIGVVQTDGFLHLKKKSKNSDLRTLFVTVGVGEKSLNMLNKFRQYSEDLFGLNPKTFYDKRSKNHVFRMGVTRLKDFFEEKKIDFSDPPKPPKWITDNKKLFGAYLAGVIDGDGDIRIKEENSVCLIRVSSGCEQNELKTAILRNLRCGVHICKRSSIRTLDGREIRGTWFELEFGVSGKTYEFLRNFVIDHIAIDHKSNRLRNFIENRYAPSGI